MRTLVTGSAGMIGSHLAERLLELGHDVIGIDNLSVGRLSNMSKVRRHKNFKFFSTDIAKMKRARHLFAGIDWVFHLAARADIVPSITDPSEYHRSNVDGTLAVLEACRESKIKKFVYAASSSCYGIPEIYPTPESAPCQPMYPYALTKYVAEQYVMHWGQVYGLPVISLRLFNVFGPRSRTNGTYGAVFGVFMSQLAHEMPLTIVGGGHQGRDFTFVDDVVEAFITAAESSTAQQIFNVGTGTSPTINQLVSILKPKDTVTVPRRPGEPNLTCADVTKIRNILGWDARWKFQDAVEKTLEDLPRFKKAPLWTPAKINVATKDWFKYLGAQ